MSSRASDEVGCPFILGGKFVQIVGVILSIIYMRGALTDTILWIHVPTNIIYLFFLGGKFIQSIGMDDAIS